MSATSASTIGQGPGESPDFSLVLGGPLFQLLRRAHLSDDALGLLRQRIMVLALLAWLPLFVLAMAQGQALGGDAAIPFLKDVEVHIRFLVALPLLIIAELVVHRRISIVLGPLLVFTPMLSGVKRNGLMEYGTLAQRYVREFDGKWLRGGAAADEPLIGSGDIQSLADLNNGFEVVRTMRITPVTRDALLQLGAATLLPIVPLALTMMPLEELLTRLFGLLL